MILEDLTNGLQISVELPRGAKGYVVVDSAVDLTSSGGVRVAPDLSAGEISTLAREMTLKFSFVGLPRGGAKSGVQLPTDVTPDEKRAILKDFGRKLAPLIRTGVYFPGMDMNCGPDDLREIYAGAGIALGEITDTSYFTAISVANAIEAVREIAGETGRPLTVAIEGFGSVGAYLVGRLPREHFRIVALSTVQGAVADPAGFDVGELLRLRRDHGDWLVSSLGAERKVPLVAVLAAEADILVPAARILSLNGETMTGVRARFVVPAANAPYTDEAVDFLHRAGVLCLPGYVTNSGGVFASGLRDSGVAVPRIEAIAAGPYRAALRALLRRSQELCVSPVHLAEQVAVARLAEMTRTGGGRSRSERMLKRLFQKGLVPGAVHGAAVARRFERNLERLVMQIAGHDHA